MGNRVGPRAGLVMPGVILALVALGAGIATAAAAAMSPFSASHRAVPAYAQSQGANGSWSPLAPPRTSEAGMTYDRARHRVLVFGGNSGNNNVTDDLWALDMLGGGWSLVATTGARPPGRHAMVLVCDPAHDKLWLFAGADGNENSLGDLWSASLASNPLSWTPVTPSGTPPSARGYASATLDTLNDRIIVFGGAANIGNDGPPSGMTSDVWTLSLSGSPAWTQLSPTGTAPTARAGAQIIWNGAAQRLMVFGGFDGNAFLNDFYQLTLTGTPAWSAPAVTGGPPPGRAVAATTWDPANARVVMYGGIGGNGNTPLTDAWSLSLGSLTWTTLSPGGGPPSTRQAPAGAFDAQNHGLVIYSARDTSGQGVPDVAWRLGLSGSPMWTQLGGNAIPGRDQCGSALDPVRHRLIVYGGQAWPNYLSDVWSLDFASGAWSQWSPTGGGPGGRSGQTMIYDAVGDRMIVFGGWNNVTQNNDAWALSLTGSPAWTPLSTSGGPPSGRSGHSAVYDSQRRRMVITGGEGGPGSGDTWSLDLATLHWTQLDNGTGPLGGRGDHVAVYDSGRDRIVLFGGSNDSNAWVMSMSGSPSWSILPVTGTPPIAHFGGAAGYDPVANVMLVFGGATAQFDSVRNETYALTLRDNPGWIPLDLGVNVPAGRRGLASAYDPSTQKFYAGAGCCGSSDWWAAAFDRATPALSSLVSEDATPDGVDLAWYVADHSWVTVQRNSGKGWESLSNGFADGSGMVRFHDTQVVSGMRYGYRLLIPGASSAPSSEVWVDVPAAQLALAGFRPNPAVGDAQLAFRLGSAAPARIAMIDVTGRTVFAREVGALGAGPHTLAAPGMRAGVYLLSLTQQGRTVTQKAVLMH